MLMRKSERSRRSSQFLRGDRLGVILLLVFFGVLVLPPFYYLIETSLLPQGAQGDISQASLDNFVELVTEDGFISTLGTTLVFGVGSMAVALVLGTSQAYLVERTDTPFKGLTYIISIVSLGFPQIVYAVAWTLLLARSGNINDILQRLSGGRAPILDAQTLYGMIFVEGLIWSPLVFLTMSAIFRNADASLEEAAAMSGASWWSTVRWVSLPMTKPAAYAAALVVFIRTIESFSVPIILGLPGGVHVLTTDLFLAIRQEIPADYGAAAATAILMLVFVMALVGYQARKLGDGRRFQSITGKAFRPRRLSLGRWRWVSAAFLATNFMLLVVLPLLIITWAAFQRFYVPFSVDAFQQNLTTGNITAVVTSSIIRTSFLNTLFVAAAAATVVTITTGVAGWFVARQRPYSGLLNQVSNIPIVFPNIVLGLALAQMYLQTLPALYASIWLIIIAYATRSLPYGLRYAQSGAVQIQRDLEESAQVCGAGAATVARRVVAPLIAPSLAASWLFIFLLTARDLPIALLLAGPNSQMVATQVYDLWQGGGLIALAGIGLVWAVVMFVFAGLFYAVTRRFNITGGA
ncbi:MAG: ABC transporter permease subunit [Ornithinimicrobium sp.]